MIVWELRLYANDGKHVAVFDIWPELRVTVGVNRPAVYSLRLSGDDPRTALFEQDGILEGWWTDAEAGIGWRREFCAFCIDRRRWTDANGVRYFESSGLGLEDLLNRTIIDVVADSAASRKNGHGETVLKAWVNKHAGPGAGTRARSGLTIEADAGRGSSWAGQRSNRNLFTVCQQVAEATGVQFGIERTGEYAFEFRVWTPMDRRATVRFSEEFGNLREPELSETQSQVVNWVKAGGEGAGGDRAVAYAVDAASVALSPQNRRERFVNATDQGTGDELDGRAAQELVANRAQVSFEFKTLQTPGTRYGLHYGLGDYVTAIYDGTAYGRRVDSVSWTVNADGAEVQIGTIAVGT